MIREAIDVLVSGRSLTQQEAASVMEEIMTGQATPAQIGAFLTALRIKGETVDEVAGMARVMRDKALRVEVSGLVVDIVGTGGDGKGTFNISTAAALVMAGAGVRVAKHGNRAASGICGSADLLEACGVKLALSPASVKRCVEEFGIGFMFAQAFHPAMHFAAPVRREIGIRTVFNILGPLTNPAFVQYQLVGVPHERFGPLVANALNALGSKHAIVVHGEDGLDELTLAGLTHVWEVTGGQVTESTMAPEQAGLPRAPTEALKGGNAQQNKETLERLLGGEKGPIRDVVLYNAAAGLLAADAVRDLRSGVRRAAESVDSGKAMKALTGLAELSQKLE
ncbi:MAG: anthranilate phosphoribosyltransferase [Dehalococcoidia bacterium]|nr:anthranilate phosphoribosyltransferase [Dehalococcoidia bacterium]